MIPTDLRQGDTFRRVLSLTYKGSGEPADLTGCTAYCQVRRSPGQELLLNASATINGGEIMVLLTRQQTGSLEPGEYGFDVRLECDGDRRTLYTEWINLIKPFTERSDE